MYGMMKKTTSNSMERFSPGWIRSIPRWLAKGIWDAIEDAVDGKEHGHAKENERRRRQIERGIIKPTATADDYSEQLQAADSRAMAREQARADIRAARASAAEQLSAGISNLRDNAERSEDEAELLSGPGGSDDGDDERGSLDGDGRVHADPGGEGA